MKKVVIYLDVSDFLLEDGYYRIFKNNEGWTRDYTEAQWYTVAEAEALCNSHTGWRIMER